MITPNSAASVPAEAVVPVHRRPVAAAFSALIALAALTGIVIDLAISDSALRVLSYFTIQSNILVAVVLALSAVRAWTARPALPPLVTGGVLLFICITGIVYHFVLANSSSGFSMTDDPDQVMSGWRSVSNQLLHTVTPIATVLNWLLFTRPGTLRLRHAGLWLIYPFAYFGFALIRGAIMTPGTPARYPYPFLDVDIHGYAGVLGNAVIFGLAFYVLALALVGLDRIRPEIRGPENRISSPGPGGLK
ncbi:integral membrane regulator [Streptomyces sp. SID8379]|uniref:Pr6Pr family membrane protein n=1 Tax=unclassified Streptomyces TaxID=2593676 RepID=UPI0003A3F07D|nr:MULTISPECIES: Pr6Pr family membrane protein [unclassified Streptomyces]MYW70374.1 integral membrane regulator [Streptomyces sp. SID8379]